MAKEKMNISNLISGVLKIVGPTEKRTSNRSVVWAAECVCGEIVHDSKANFEKWAGYTECPGHPPKGLSAMPVEGFRLHPDMKGTLEQAEAAVAWELKRNPMPPEEVRLSEEPEPNQQDAPEKKEAPKDRDTSPKPSEVLQKRLGLTGYTTSSVALTTQIDLLGCKAEKVVFAKQITGDDLVLLHVQLIDAKGKRSIVSSKKKVSDAEWTALTAQLAEMKIDFREKEMKRKVA